jgi:hypothetical protein
MASQFVTPSTSWHGTRWEQRDLLRALSRNCACKFGPVGIRVSSCPAHRMLVEDQRALNGLVFARRLANAEAALETAQNNLQAATLVMPADGIVASLNGSVGQWLSGGPTWPQKQRRARCSDSTTPRAASPSRGRPR